MKAPRWMGLATLAAVCCLASCCKNGSRTDITLQGPWILYQDKEFPTSHGKISVLIAIAPKDAIGPTGPDDMQHHMPPLMASGDGYSVEEHNIYCLAFDDNCAPKGPRQLQQDDFPAPGVLRDYSPSPWDWVNAAQQQTAFILPMPDSYSSKGKWYMKFSSKPQSDYDYVQGETHSIGIELHYAHGPSKFHLFLCDSQHPSGSSCVQFKNDKHRELKNTGALQIVMRTPQRMDGCDLHVRLAHHVMLGLIDPQNHFDSAIAYIEPAWENGDGNPIYDTPDNHPCWENDPQGQPIVHQDSNAQSFRQLLDHILDSLSQFGCSTKKSSGTSSAELAISSPLCGDILSLSNDIDTSFPRLSELAMLRELLGRAYAEAQQMAKTPAPKSLRVEKDTRGSNLNTLGNLLDKLDDAHPAKTGSDCLAAPILVSEQP